jgi:recombination protein RecA
MSDKASTLLKKFKDYIQTADVPRPHELVSLGPLSLNIAAGDAKGFKSGRIVQIFGKESSGKSTLSLDIIAQYQKANPDASVLYVDFERSLDEKYAAAIGVDLQRLLVARTDNMERGFDIIYACIESGIKLIIIDSIMAGIPKVEETKDADESPKMASTAGLITIFVRKVVPLLDDNDVMLIIINQMRSNFNTMSPEKEIPGGGQALQFHSNLKLAVQKIKTEGTKQRTQVVVKKNKSDAPQGRAEFTINYGRGIDHAADIIELAESRDIVRKSGSWYTYRDLRAQGLENAAQTFPIEEIKEALLA